MNTQQVVTKLSRICPLEPVYQITMETILFAIVKRLGEEALTLSAEDLHLARDEVKAAIDHHLDEREYIDMGLEVWQLVRNL